MIAVHPEPQRRGYGRVLMGFALQRLYDHGLKLVDVATGGDPGHASARALYDAVGFTELPLVNYYMASRGGAVANPAGVARALPFG